MAKLGLSSHEEKMVQLQYQLRENQQELQDVLSDLGNWEDQIKTKEEELKKKKSSEQLQKLPPVRNSLDKKKLKKKKESESSKKPKRISGADFRAWDKYDVDKALQEIDQSEEKTSSEYETDEEWEIERKKQLADEEKNKGNSHMNAGAYDVAIECYTHGIEIDPTNPLLPANRAMALLKLQKYGAAEIDCHTAISLDPLYVKGYLRRAAARIGLKRLSEALDDYNRVLQLEPTNKQAKSEIERLEKEQERDKEQTPSKTSLETTESCVVKPIYKVPEERSKKPLRRLEIQEIGLEQNTKQKEAIAKVVATQSTAKKEMEAKDKEMFEHFVGHSACGVTDSAKTISRDLENRGMLAACEDHTAEHCETKKNESVEEYSDLNPAAVDAATKKSDISRKRTHSTDLKPLPLQTHTGGSASLAGVLEKDPPQTSFQFQADFKVLKSDLHAFYNYFKRIDPVQYSKLFGQSLEAPVLLKIVDAIKEHFIPSGEDFYHLLKELSKVKRFSMTVMFLSSKEKQGLKDIFQHLRMMYPYSAVDIEALAKKYEV